MNDRTCPLCGRTLTYGTPGALKNAMRNGRPCRSCSMKGKKVSRATKKKLRNVNLGKRYADEVNAKKGSPGRRNPMYGKSFYDVWTEKYGAEEADRRMEALRRKQSRNASGKHNPMYGRPSPQGSGNGWSGWYNGVSFRSLLELGYMMKAEQSGERISSAERKEYEVKYVAFDGTEKTYRPDFVHDESGTIVEVKPKHLVKSRENAAKFSAARKRFGKKFVVVTEDDIKRPTDDEIEKLYMAGSIRFTDRYDRKMTERIDEKGKDKNKQPL